MTIDPKFSSLEKCLNAISACTECSAKLPFGPRPVVRAAVASRILIAGQAPGTRVHETGIPWNDQSGRRLRDWLGVSESCFYDADNFALVPQGFCYPGKAANGGDLPPRPECARLWHVGLISLLPNIELILAVGQYAQAWHLKDRRKKNMTETVRSYADYLPGIMALPHPSWRVTGWIKKNPWFERDILPVLQTKVKNILR